MEAIAHNAAFARRAGVPQSVGQDFAAADKGVWGVKKRRARKPRADRGVFN
jgi:hypothetical protein